MKKQILLIIFCIATIGTFAQTNKLLAPVEHLKLYLGIDSSQNDTIRFDIQKSVRTNEFVYFHIRFYPYNRTAIYGIDLKEKKTQMIDSAEYLHKLGIFKFKDKVYSVKNFTTESEVYELKGLAKKDGFELPSGFRFSGDIISTNKKNIYFKGYAPTSGNGVYGYNFESEKIRLVYQDIVYGNRYIYNLMPIGDSMALYHTRDRRWKVGYGINNILDVGKRKEEWIFFNSGYYRKDSMSENIFSMKPNGDIKDTIFKIPSDYEFVHFDTLGNNAFVAFIDSVVLRMHYYIIDTKNAQLVKSFSCQIAPKTQLVSLGKNKVVQFLKPDTGQKSMDSLVVYGFNGDRLYGHSLDTLGWRFGENYQKPFTLASNGAILFSVYSKDNSNDQNYIYSINFSGDKLTQLTHPSKKFWIWDESRLFEYDKNLFLIENDSNGIVVNKLTENIIELKLKYFLDADKDSTLDQEEFELKEFSVNIGNQKYFFDDNYSLYLELDSYTVTPSIAAIWKLSGNPQVHINPFETNKRVFDVHFGLTPAKEKLRIKGLVSGVPTRCGFKTWLRPKVVNTGNKALNASITFTVDTLAKVDSFSRKPDTTVNNTHTWYFENLNPTEFRAVRVYLQMPGVTYRGRRMNFDSYFSGFSDGADTVYNKDTTKKVLSCSYDPNDKTVWPQRTQHNDQTLFEEDMTFRIRFQNTGNDTAFNVMVADTLSKHLDWSTFSILDYSHPMRTKMYDNGLVEFYFDDILLPDSNVNEPESHGFITYTVKADSSLKEQTEINNTAYIYFDFNPAIITNTTRNIMVSEIVGVGPGLQKELLPIDFYPNPAKSLITVELKEFGPAEIRISTLDGRLVQTATTNNRKEQLNINGLSKGLYIINVLQNGNTYQAKLIKE